MLNRLIFSLIPLFALCVPSSFLYVKAAEPVGFSEIRIDDPFWSPRLKNHKEVTVHVCLDQIENKTGRIRNFENAALGEGKHSGIFFDDSDVYKALEGFAYTLKNNPDPELEAKCDEWIDKFAAAQQADGYINTFYTLTGLDKRWSDMDKHEMYCAGHMIEAAVAFYEATGKRKMLDICERMVAHMMNTFGPEKRHWVPGHEEIELALVKLYKATGKSEYLDFSHWLLEERGHGNGYYANGWNPSYYQDAVPVGELAGISGHAVRLMYLLCGMADVAEIIGDESYMAALERVWDVVVNRNMYVTGGIGASKSNEGFAGDYNLPNMTAYCETCASVGMVLWNWRMNRMSGDAKYIDVLERSLYNGALAGISLDGGRFFYVNPLESEGRHHRKEWYGCACCPSQICRFLPSIGNYIYCSSPDALWVNLFIGNESDFCNIKTSYPWNGRIEMSLGPKACGMRTVYVRIPSWCESYSLTVNGRKFTADKELGYAVLKKKWKEGDSIVLDMDMPVRLESADPRVKQDVGKRTVMRGPLVYCLEEADNKDMDNAVLFGGDSFKLMERKDELGGIVRISSGTGLSFIPYYAWDNRTPGKMKVWVDYQDHSSLYDDFCNPTSSARPRVWWHWMNGNITKDGIRKDLNWLHDVGVVGFHNFDANLDTPQIVEKRLAYMTPEWKDAFNYALDVADSLGMEVTIASSPGWSETGGPWVSEDDAMKKLVWRQLDIQGNGKVQTIRIPDGFSCQGIFQDDENLHWDTDQKKDYYRDIAVLGVKLEAADLDFSSMSPHITVSDRDAGISFDAINSDSIKDGLRVKEDAEGVAWIQYEFDEAVTVKSLVVSDRKAQGDIFAVDRFLLCSDDGVNFRRVATLGYQSIIQKTYSIPATTARYFRFQVNDRQKIKDGIIDIYQCILSSAPRIQDAGDKAGFGYYRLVYLEDTVPDSSGVKLENVVDLTSMVKNGSLEWKVPDGRWRIFRFGYSLTGKTNHPASPEATGLEVDKIDSTAIRNYYENYLSTYRDASCGRLGPGGISYMLTDSFEAGPQTWTGRMFEEFRSREGYDLLKWLPALTGMVIENTASTERFLFDWRRCIGDMIAEYHYDLQNSVLAKYGMKRYTESHENYRANLSDGMDCKKLADIPMSAFWMQYNQGKIFTPRFEADIRESASVAHIYGQNIAAAESFTSDGFRDGAWVFSPSVLKPVADAAMASGLNRFVIHCSPHQPVDDKFPGLGLGKYGQWFDRHQSWSCSTKAWVDYLSRSCEMLQKGRYVADIAVYYGEDNNLTGIYLSHRPDVPDGYSFDYFNPTVLLDVAKAENGRIITPSGMEYKVLYIGQNNRIMSLSVLRKIKEFADAGVPICGYVPSALASNRGTVEEFDALVKDIWNSGRPNVSGNKTLSQMLDEAGIAPDFSAADVPVKFVHRHLPEGEVYWVSNQSDKNLTTEASFRISGRKPLVWHAEDASVEAVSYRIADGRTCVHLSLSPYQSYFVVFTELSESDDFSAPVFNEEIISNLSGPWTVTFQQERGAPESIRMETLFSLSESAIPGVKYFSGEALYSNAFKLKPKAIESNDRFVLDLGSVADVAEVVVNGKSVGTLIHAPYRIDISSAIHPGENTIQIKVSNVWHNRIVGDMQPEMKEKVTYYPIDLLKADEPLLPSGLIGPVTLNAQKSR